jgi:hypothetical protein
MALNQSEERKLKQSLIRLRGKGTKKRRRDGEARNLSRRERVRKMTAIMPEIEQKNKPVKTGPC